MGKIVKMYTNHDKVNTTVASKSQSRVTDDELMVIMVAGFTVVAAWNVLLLEGFLGFRHQLTTPVLGLQLVGRPKRPY